MPDATPKVKATAKATTATEPVPTAKVQKPSKYANESGAAKFKRVGTRRLQNVVKHLRGLTNVAKGPAYDVTADGAKIMMGHLDAAVNELRETLVRRVNGARKVEDITL